MRQLTYVSPRVLEWRDAPEARLQDDADALVRPIAVTRCDLDIFIVNGTIGWPGPFAIGHEVLGEVTQVGERVRNVRPGERVIVPFQLSCGACGRCRAGLTGLCETLPYRSSYGMAPLSGVDHGGGLSDLLRVPFADHMLVHAPTELEPEALAGVADNVTTAMTFVSGPLRQRPGCEILIIGGQGKGVGLHIVQCALALGAGRVVYVDDDRRSLELVQRVGGEPVELTLDMETPPIGSFPFTIDASGYVEGLAFAIRCTDYEGLCQRTYGDFKPMTQVPLREMYARNITLKLGRVHARAHMPAAVELMRCGRLHPEHVITRRASFEDAAEAMLDPTNKVVFIT
jgi:threonine dehydrogenase-like Zn-dependent dehydrogenase